MVEGRRGGQRNALSTASWPVREAHRPQIRGLMPRRFRPRLLNLFCRRSWPPITCPRGGCRPRDNRMRSVRRSTFSISGNFTHVQEGKGVTSSDPTDEGVLVWRRPPFIRIARPCATTSCSALHRTGCTSSAGLLPCYWHGAIVGDGCLPGRKLPAPTSSGLDHSQACPLGGAAGGLNHVYMAKTGEPTAADAGAGRRKVRTARKPTRQIVAV